MEIDLLISEVRIEESSMRQAHKIIAVFGTLLLLVAVSYGQSLGDVAREQRQKQAKNAHATPKVITNENIPQAEESVSQTTVSTSQRDTADTAPASNDTHAAEHWKAKIEAQKNSVASLQSQLDALNSSIHFAPGNCVANCVQYNQHQVEKQDEAKRMQEQLDQQKKQLEDMQESARKAGLGSSIYE
jgi:hypothetical protein